MGEETKTAKNSAKRFSGIELEARREITMSVRRPRYSYRYFVQGTQQPLLLCPQCGHDLTLPEEGVTVVLYYGNGKSEAGLVEILSSLEPDGQLIDEDDQVAQGFHSTTLCHHCGEQLFQHADEVLTAEGE